MSDDAAVSDMIGDVVSDLLTIGLIHQTIGLAVSDLYDRMQSPPVGWRLDEHTRFWLPPN